MERENVVLVVLDSVSAQRVSAYGYDLDTTPNIDQFASDSVLFDRCIAASSWTIPTHGTLFTGRYPSEHGAHAKHKRFAVEEGRSLAEQLRNSGYETAGFSSNRWVTSKFGFDAGFDTFEYVPVPMWFDADSHPREFLSAVGDDSIRKYTKFVRWLMEGNPIKRGANMVKYRWLDDEGYADGETVTNRIRSWLRDERDEDRPFFLFTNYMDAHQPYNPGRPYRDEFVDGERSVDVDWVLRSIDQELTEEEVDYVNDLYDASLRYLDEQIGRLLASLEKEGLREETTVVLTADHGICLGEHDYMGMATFLYDELTHVPLIISPAGDQRECEHDFEETVVGQRDVYATLLSRAGQEPDAGRNLLTGERFDDHPDALLGQTHGLTQEYTVQSRRIPESGYTRVDTDGWSVIWDDDTEEAVHVSGPESGREGERPEGAPEVPQTLPEVRERIEDRLEPIAREASAVEMDDDTYRRLRNLGYV